jgi:UDP-N-acetylmuramate dehydrogenase
MGIAYRDAVPAAPMLAELTTLGVGGPARRLVEASTADALIDAVRAADAAGEPVLLVAGGSNLVIGDDGFDGTVVLVRSRGVDVVDNSACGGVSVTVDAGHPWDELVAQAVSSGWVGVEALSGIPGSTGATPIQNVGAYGQEVAQTIASIRTYDRHAGSITTFAAGDCGFAYRSSMFKGVDRYAIVSVTFQFTVGELSAPIAYAELARTLGVDVGDRAPLAQVREAVLALRRGKGMVIDPADPDSRSAGSFFTNPVVSADVAQALPDGAPRWPQPDGRVKTSAAWLIENSGFGKGYGEGRARLSFKHTLALTNRGGATASDIVGLADAIRRGVASSFGIVLEPEPNLVGVSLPKVQT